MGEAIEVWRGGVAPWECDASGRLAEDRHMARAMTGLLGLAAELGMPQAFAPHGDATLAVREQHIRFLGAAEPGARLVMEAGVLDMGEADARVQLLMRRHDGGLATIFDLRVVHVTAREGRAFPWPAWARERAQRLTIAPVKAPGPNLAPTTDALDEASLARAQTLGFARSGLGAVRPGDLDPFGRLRPELAVAAVSDATSHRLGAPPAGADRSVGAITLEHRLHVRDWPRMGERWEIRSGILQAEPERLRIAHWILDPATGEPWATAETASAPFDLLAREKTVLSQAELAPWRALCVPLGG